MGECVCSTSATSWQDTPPTATAPPPRHPDHCRPPDALTDTWRAAPPEQRDAFGPAAATAHALTGNLTSAAAVSSHLPRADPITKVVTLQMDLDMSAPRSAQRFISDQNKGWTPPPRHTSSPSLDHTSRTTPTSTCTTVLHTTGSLDTNSDPSTHPACGPRAYRGEVLRARG